jgi:Fe-S cluster assembly ATP-binding protein
MLEVKNVGLTLKGDNGEIQVLKDVNFTLEDKKIYVMTGPNGGGKSVTAKTIMGIHRPHQRAILLEGVDITDKAALRTARMHRLRIQQLPA